MVVSLLWRRNASQVESSSTCPNATIDDEGVRSSPFDLTSVWVCKEAGARDTRIDN
jgi:hypothetical protein